jgi:hypothetical protein
MTQQTYDANAVLMGGGGPKGWKFEDPGTTRTGTVAEAPKAVQERDYDPNNPGGGAPKVFPSGDPIMGVHVVVQTTERDPSIDGDDGRRTFYIEGRYIKEAVREAVRNAGSPGLEIGGQLTVTFTHREDPMDKRSRKFWTVQYVPAGNASLMGEQPPAAAPQQATPPAAQPPAPVQAPPVQQVPAPAPAAAVPGLPPGMTAEQFAAFQQYQAQQAQQQPT